MIGGDMRNRYAKEVRLFSRRTDAAQIATAFVKCASVIPTHPLPLLHLCRNTIWKA